MENEISMRSLLKTQAVIFKNGLVELSFIRFPDLDSAEMGCSKGKIMATFQEGKGIEIGNQTG